MPKISVIVPVYKVEDYLSRCVDSILNQTFQDFELILVDDGSPDNCGKICDDYAKKDSRITVIHKENGGLSDARNAGIDWAFEKSDSEWLTFIDSDDWIHSQYLEFLLEANLTNVTNISLAKVYCVEEFNNIFDKEKNDFTLINPNQAFCDEEYDPNSSCARLFKKELFSHIRFPKGRIHEDSFTTYKLYFNEENVSAVNVNLYFYFQNPESIIHSKWNPQKMDLIEAGESQLAFFKSIGNTEMYNYVLKKHLRNTLFCMRAISGSVEYKKYSNILKRKLRFLIKENKKTLNLSMKDSFNVYKYAYPITSKVYRRIVTGVFKKDV